MESSTAMPKLRSSLPMTSLFWVERTTRSTAMAMGTIMAAVAVLDTQAERPAVASIRPSTICLGWVPKRRSVSSAMRRSRCQRWMPAASRKPPRKRKIVPEA